MRAGEIADMLARDPEGVASMLLPGGKRKGRHLVAGSVAGEAGESLKVILTGDRHGQWSDFATEEGGDLIDLWAAAKSISLADAIQEAADYLGVKRTHLTGSRPEPAKLQRPEGITKAASDRRVMQWLTGDRRIPAETVEAYKISARNGMAAFPALSPEGELQYVKYRGIAEKKFHSEAGGKPCLFGWQAVPDGARTVVICEGEGDALAWHAYGYPALSPTNGAGNAGWIDAEFDRLERFDVIYVSYDMDDAGRKGCMEVIDRLGRERCRVVSLPAKDCGDCLMGDVASFEIDLAISKAKTLDPEELVPAESFADEVVGLFHPVGDPDPGIRPPWQKVKTLVFRRGEVSLVAGINGHGKSQMVGQLTLEAMSCGERCCVASMEFRPGRWLQRLTRQAAGCERPTPEYIHDIHGWYAGKLWAFAASGTAKASRIVEVMGYARRRYGVRWFVIDNLAKCGFAEDDYNGQKDFIDQLTDFARDNECHVMVCVHMRKGQSEHMRSGKMDVKGTGAITDMVDTVMTIWRNKPKEIERSKAQSSGEHFDESQEDALFECTKQRNGESEPRIKLWFCPKSNQYLGRQGDRPHSYVQFRSNGNG